MQVFQYYCKRHFSGMFGPQVQSTLVLRLNPSCRALDAGVNPQACPFHTVKMCRYLSLLCDPING